MSDKTDQLSSNLKYLTELTIQQFEQEYEAVGDLLEVSNKESVRLEQQNAILLTFLPSHSMACKQYGPLKNCETCQVLEKIKDISDA